MVIKGRTLQTAILLKVAYLILLATTIFYVKSVLDADSFRATEKVVEKRAVKVREVSVHLVVETNQETKEYKAKLKNIDTVNDLLKEVQDNQGMYYEKDLYTYGAEIISVFDKEANLGNKWAVFLDNKNITHKISGEYLANGAIYTLKQVAI